MFTEIELFESPDLTPFNVCLWSRKKSEVYERKVKRRDELLACISDAAASVKKHEAQLRRTTFIVNHKKFVISVSQIRHLNIKLILNYN